MIQLTQTVDQKKAETNQIILATPPAHCLVTGTFLKTFATTCRAYISASTKFFATADASMTASILSLAGIYIDPFISFTLG